MILFLRYQSAILVEKAVQANKRMLPLIRGHILFVSSFLCDWSSWFWIDHSNCKGDQAIIKTQMN